MRTRGHRPRSATLPAPQGTGTAFIGISGYTYAGWRGSFYPRELSPRRWLSFASREFNSIELNGTFYSLKSPAVYRRWVDETPDEFVFAIKGSRFITHNLKLARAEGALANFMASGVLALGRKTGPFLWQLPATYHFERARLASFLKLLPRDSRQAARLATHHDDRLRRGALVRADEPIAYRHAIELRHPSWFVPECYDLLREHDVALVIADTAGKFPYAEELTASFVYVRLHGSEVLYASRYSDDELDDWSDKVRRWAQPIPGEARDVFVYFDNDAKAHAPGDARRLAGRVVAGVTG